MQLKKTERIYAMKVVKKELVNDDEVSNAGAIKHARFSLEKMDKGRLEAAERRFPWLSNIK